MIRILAAVGLVVYEVCPFSKSWPSAKHKSLEQSASRKPATHALLTADFAHVGPFRGRRDRLADSADRRARTDESNGSSSGARRLDRPAFLSAGRSLTGPALVLGSGTRGKFLDS
jgi:hypothetical protein